MPLTLNRIGQIALAVRDVDKAEAFYRDVLRLRWLYRFGDLTFLDCSGVRLLLGKASELGEASGSPIYFSYADIDLAVRELEQREVTFTSKPRLIAPWRITISGWRSSMTRTAILLRLCTKPEGLHPGIGLRDRQALACSFEQIVW
jgi:methylmalonyl-CoA/ethylmalonyl-CoA epimerase